MAGTPAAGSTLLRQDRFGGGEISEDQYGRVEDPLYHASLRTCLNFIPLPRGSLVNRPGTLKIAQTGGGGAIPRFERFIFSSDDVVLLEFGNFYIRFYVNGARLETSPGVALEVTTVYALADVMALDMAQSGDVVTITHPSYPIYSLTRLSTLSWTIALEPFGPPAGFIPKTLAIPERAAENAPAYNGATVYQPGQYVNDGNNTFIAVLTSVGHTPQGWSQDNPWWEVALDSTKILRDWEVVVTALYKDDRGRKLESLPSTKASMYSFISEERPAQYTWAAPDNPGFSYKLTGYRVYRGRNGLWGFMEDVGPTILTFKDIGKEPNYAIQPPKGTNPFKIADGNNTETTTLWPAVVAYHEGRRVYALLNRFVGSKLDNFTNFDFNFPVQDTDSYDYKVYSQKFERSRHLLSLHQLMLFTSESEFTAEGTPGQAITSTSVRVRRHSDHGSSVLKPLVIGNAAIFNTAKGNYVRDFQYNFNNGAFGGNDLTVRARHLFSGHTLVDWDVQEVPYPILWGVRDDGVLLSCTYDPPAQVLAWARHSLGGNGLARRVRCLPEATEDSVCICAERGGLGYVERMASRYVSDIRKAVFLDSAVQYDGHPAALGFSGRTLKIDSIDNPGSVNPADYVTGKQISILASVAGVFVIGDVDAKTVVFNPDDPANAFRATVRGYTSSALVMAELNDDLTQAEVTLWTAGGSAGTLLWGFERSVILGLDHLNGSIVTVLADGFVQGPFYVAGGSIGPLNPPAMYAVAGLPYNADAEPLDVAAPSVKSNVKDVMKVIVEVVSSRGFWAGKDFAHLREWKQRRVSDAWAPPPVATDQVEIVIDSPWDISGRAVVRQVDPLPLTIVALTREVVLGGR